MTSDSNKAFSLATREFSGRGQLYCALAAAGFCGALLRFCAQSLPLPWLCDFPVGTLCANVLGSFIIFLMFHLSARKGRLSAQALKVVNTGFLGAFTTMSAVGTDAITLLNSGNALLSAVYVAATLALTFGACVLAALMCRGGEEVSRG